MSPKMIQLENEAEDLLLSKTKNCEMLIRQTHRKAEEILEYNLTKPRETFSFKPSNNLGLHSNLMIGLTSLEVYNSIFNKTEDKKQIHFLYRLF